MEYERVEGRPNWWLEGRHHYVQIKKNPKIHYETNWGRDKFCLTEDRYYVLGDNRLASGDSRDFGPISKNEIEGKVRWVWYSFDKESGEFRRNRVLHGVD